ncbi:MAG: lamin tail domain-containing protein [Bacteroidales bacterium]|nr:lamin tail domain-containing protein [Bacteroidales bacterium]
MADPAPCVGLPEVEYIEIFNRTLTRMNLRDWLLIAGKYQKLLPDAWIEPGEYLILIDQSSDTLMASFGKTIAVTGMPPILNSGQTLTIKNTEGTVTHTVTFTDHWYRNSKKADGGWSLEIIDPGNPCGGIENWSVSTDPAGGTPGKRNSCFADNPDIQAPVLIRATLPSDSMILLHFSEPMSFVSLNSTGAYSANQGLYHPLIVYPVEPEYSTTLLKYPEAFHSELHYTVSVMSSLRDCAGNSLQGNATADFALAGRPSAGDVIFNEIMFSPAEGLSEFIEFFNRSDQVIDMASFQLSLSDEVSGTIKQTFTFRNHPFILFPRRYVVIAKDTRNLMHENKGRYVSALLEIPELFRLPNEGALLVLSDTNSQIIDELGYNNRMHDNLLGDTHGVSLERIDPYKPAGDATNWQSASTASGYATPGYINSQHMNREVDPGISLSSDICSPDNDGTDDVIILHLNMNEPGWKASISVYDVRGIKVRDLAANCLLGADEYLEWDGKKANNEPADMGVYIIRGQLFHHGGKIKNFKKVISIVRRL